MIKQYERGDVVWIDLESPTPEEIEEVSEKYALHPLVSRELSSPSERQKIDLYEDYMYFVLHFPAVGHNHGSHSTEEIDVVLGKDFLITTHYEPHDVIREFAGVFEVESLIKKGRHDLHAGFVFYALMQRLYSSLEEQLDRIDDQLEEAKAAVFHHKERAMVERIANINKNLLDFRIALKSHGSIWNSFEKAGAIFFDKKFAYYLSAISGWYQKISTMLDGSREILTDLRQTNDSLLSTRMNETMIHLTMMAFVVFPLNLISGIFSMNTVHHPIVGAPNDFAKILGIMAITTLFFFTFFKHRKWL